MTSNKSISLVLPYLIVRNASEAIQFYQKAFDAKEIYRYSNKEGNVIMHAEIEIGDYSIFLADECEGSTPFSNLYRSPETLNATSVILHVYTDDVDSLYEQALNAGVESIMPLTEMFWGDRYGQVKDPYGHLWSLATQIKHMTQDEILEAGRKASNPDHK